MSKKLLCLTLAAVMLTPGMVFAAQTSYSTGFTNVSLENEKSQGVFSNEIDNAINPNENNYGLGFSELKHSYFLGGLGNYENKKADQLATSDGVFLGYYMNGNMPWSFICKINQSGADESKNSTTYANPQSTAVGSDFVTWDGRKTVTEYNNRLIDVMNDQFQFLINIKPFTTGLYFRIYRDNNTLAANNYTATETNYYNAAGAGVTPSITKDYEIKTELVNQVNGTPTITAFTIAVPFFFKGNFSHFAKLAFSHESMSGDNYASKKYSDHVNAIAGGIKYVTDFGASTFSDITSLGYKRSYSYNDIDLEYNIILPSMIGNNPENKLIIYGSTNLGLENGEYEAGVNAAEKTFNAAGATVLGEVNNDYYKFTTETALDFTGTATVAHSLYTDLTESLKFGLIPTYTIQFKSDAAGAGITGLTYTNKDDANGDGDFTDAGDSNDTTKYTYTNLIIKDSDLTNSITPGPTDPTLPFSDKSRTNTITNTLTIPIALRFHPNDWFLGITVASKPSCSYAKSYTTTTGNTTTKVYTHITGDGATTTTAKTTTKSNSSETVTTNSSWAFGVTHSLGLNFDLPKDAKIYVAMNAANLLSFESFTVQASIPFDSVFASSNEASTTPTSTKKINK